MKLRYAAVTVNDAYAELNETHLVGGGADVMCHVNCDAPEPLPYPYSNRVFVGWIRLKSDQQWDKLISLSKANGGSSELKIGRSSGYLKMEGGQVTDFQDIITPDKKFKRKDIRKGRWRKLYAMWDPDWKADNKEQVLAAWEADNKGEQTFSGSITTTLKNVWGASVAGVISYSIKVVSENPPIRQLKMDRILTSAQQSSIRDAAFKCVMIRDADTILTFYRQDNTGRSTIVILLSVGHFLIILTKISTFTGRYSTAGIFYYSIIYENLFKLNNFCYSISK